MHIGIDPGLSGALAVLDHTGALVALHDTPVLTLRTSRGTRHEYDVPGLVTLLAPYTGPQAHVILEESQAMPGQGTRSMFTVGLGFGVWLGILGALGLAHTRIRPHVWKRSLGLASDKEQARLRAMQLFPTADLRRKPTGKGERRIILHAMTTSGWVPGAQWTCKSTKKTGDYHGHMHQALFPTWCTEQGWPTSPGNAVLLMDNAP